MFDNKRPSNILRNANPYSNVAQGSNLIILAAPERATVGVKGKGVHPVRLVEVRIS